MTMKAASPSTTTTAPADLAAVDLLAREEVAERKGEHDRGHEERLDHCEPTVREGDRLEPVAAEERDRPGEPPLLPREFQERLRRAERHLTHAERALLLERGCESEEEGGD